MEKEAGSIEVGKRANFTTREKDPYSVEPKNLKYISFWGRMIEGREKLVAASLGNTPEQKTKEQTRARATKNSLVALGRWDTRTNKL